MDRTRHFLLALDESLAGAGFLAPEVFLHVWRMHVDPVPELYQQHKYDWKPALGLGVWPDRLAPAPWTRETFMDAGAVLLQGQEPPLNAHKLLHLAGSRTARESAIACLLGSGCLTLFWGDGEPGLFAARSRALLLPTIAARTYQSERFYTPLLSPEALAGASAEQISEWMCGMGVYAQEGPEAGGMLLLLRQPSASQPFVLSLPSAGG